MLVAMIALTLAMATLSISSRLIDQTLRLPVVIVSRLCLGLSLVCAPWVIKLLILVAILVMPVCTQRHGMRQGRCSRQCIVRFQCPQSR
jgi:hypothetical protein